MAQSDITIAHDYKPGKVEPSSTGLPEFTPTPLVPTTTNSEIVERFTPMRGEGRTEPSK